jgi:hypothetical protein
MARLSFRLKELVVLTRDHEILQFTLRNLGTGVPMQSRYQRHIERLKEELVIRFHENLWQPGIRSPEERFLERTIALARMQQYQALMQAAIRDQVQRAVIRDRILRQLSREEPAVVREKLQGEDPLTRLLAVQAAAIRRMPLEGDLIERLTDPMPEIREASRQALIRLSRGADFGPAPSATAAETKAAVTRWQAWWALQDKPEEEKAP